MQIILYRDFFSNVNRSEIYLVSLDIPENKYTKGKTYSDSEEGMGETMKEFKVIEVKRSIFEDNDADANRLREELKEEGTFLLNLMSSPGAGKTTTLKRTIAMLKDELKICVMEADIDSDVDAQAITETGVRAIQIHTGSTKNAMILSVPEGDDKPLKYLLMFSICDVVLINKCDTLSVFDDFDKDAVKERILKLNPKAEIFFVSAKTGEGFEDWANWIRREVKTYQA